MAIFSKLGNYRNTALLIIRVGVGIMMLLHGYPKLLGGVEKWERLGSIMDSFGIGGPPVFWGFMAAFAEGVGGLLLAAGLFHRFAALLLLITMLVAAAKHLSAGDGIMGASHALELAVVFMGLFILGPGKYSFDKS